MKEVKGEKTLEPEDRVVTRMWCKGHPCPHGQAKGEGGSMEKLCMVREHQVKSTPSGVSSLSKGPSQLLRGQEAL